MWPLKCLPIDCNRVLLSEHKLLVVDLFPVLLWVFGNVESFAQEVVDSPGEDLPLLFEVLLVGFPQVLIRRELREDVQPGDLRGHRARASAKNKKLKPENAIVRGRNHVVLVLDEVRLHCLQRDEGTPTELGKHRAISNTSFCMEDEWSKRLLCCLDFVALFGELVDEFVALRQWHRPVNVDSLQTVNERARNRQVFDEVCGREARL